MSHKITKAMEAYKGNGWKYANAQGRGIGGANRKNPCKALNKRTGEPCKMSAMTGVKTCHFHGGRRAKFSAGIASEHDRQLSEMSRLVRQARNYLDAVGIPLELARLPLWQAIGRIMGSARMIWYYRVRAAWQRPQWAETSQAAILYLRSVA